MREEEEARAREEAQRQELRIANSREAVALSRAEHEKRQLKSDLKKTSTFTTKVKLMSESHRASLTKDIQTLNLTRYVSEIVDGVAEAKLKPTDVSVAVHVCCMMHQRYSDFTEALIPKLLAPLREEPPPGDEEDKESYRRRRVNLRLLTELHLCGVFDGTVSLMRMMRRLAGEGPRRREEVGAARSDWRGPIEPCPPGLRANDVSLIVAFAKQAGTSMSSSAEAATYEGVLRSLYERLCSHLEGAHKELRRREKRFEKERLLCGTLHEDKEAILEASHRAYDKLLTHVTSLSEVLKEPMPELQEEKAEEELGGIELWSGEGGAPGGEGDLGPWDDEETRSFYEDLPDLLTAVLPSQLGLTTEQWEQLREEQEAKRLKRSGGEEEEGEEGPGTEEDEGEQLPEDLGMRLEALPEAEEGEEEGEAEADAEADEASRAGGALASDDEDALLGDDGAASATPDAVGNLHRLQLLLAEELPQCHNRDRTDELAIKFCQLNSKAARRRLVRSLLAVPRQALDLLPQYSRLVATLDQVLKDIAPALVEELRSENRWLLRKRTATHLIESKRKNVSFLGELVKFGVAPPVAAFSVLRGCFEDFSGNNVEMACTLLERCGRYLHRSRHSHSRLSACLEIMQRLKRAKHLDPKYEVMIDNAYYQCKPPEGGVGKAGTPLTPLQRWIRHTVFDRLTPKGLGACLRSLRRLPWDAEARANPQRPLTSTVEEPPPLPPRESAPETGKSPSDSELPPACEDEGLQAAGADAESVASSVVDKRIDVEQEVFAAFIEVAQKKFTILTLAAEVLGSLHKHHPSLTVKVVDAVLEDITFACETVGYSKDLQRRLGLARFLGELYNCALVSSIVVFDTLHRILDIGHAISSALRESAGVPLAPWATHDPRATHPCDPPGDCLRIRLVVQILEACSFPPKVRPRLTRFLLYFQRYLYCKQGLPPDTEFAVLDLLDSLRGTGIQECSSWEEAQAAVEALEEAEHHERVEKAAKDARLRAEHAAGKDLPAPEELVDDDLLDEVGSSDDDDDDEEDEDEEDEEDTLGGANDEEDGDEQQDSSSSSSSSSSGGSDAEDEEEEDVHVLTHNSAPLKTEADDEFDRMFDKLMSDNLNKSKATSHRSLRADNMAAPSLLGRIAVKEATHDMPLTGEEGVAFRMLKRGAKGKLEGQAVLIPAGTNLAAQQKRVHSKESNEHELIKQRVLAYGDSIEAATAGRYSGSDDYLGPSPNNTPIQTEREPSATGGGQSGSAGGRGGGPSRFLRRGGGAGRGASGSSRFRR